MMTYPTPSPSDHSPAPASYTSPSRRNGAAIASVVCAILWPLVLVAVLLWNSRSCTTTDTTTTCTGIATPAWFGTLTGFLLLILPPIGIIGGILGLVRSFTRPQMHGRWLAVVGLLFGLLWLVATQFL